MKGVLITEDRISTFTHLDMDIIRKYKWEILIFLLVVLTRVPDLGHDMFNTDVWKWKSRTYDFSTGVFTLDFEKTIQKYHPGVTLMWIGTAGVKIFNLYHELFLGTPPADNILQTVFALHAVQKTLIVMVIGVLLGLVLYPLRKMFGARYAWLAILLISLEPFYVALTRVMHLEGLMSTFMLASFVWFVYYLYQQDKKKLVLSSFLAAAAFLTKTSSLFLVPLFGLIILIESFSAGDDLVTALVSKMKIFLGWLGVTILFFILFWPAMYTHAPLALQTMYRGVSTIGIEREHFQLFLGRWVEDPGPLFYLVVYVYRSSWWLIIGLLGYLFTNKKIAKRPFKSNFMIYTFLFIIFYIVELAIPSKKLDRYILPSIIASVLIAAFFFEHVLIFIKGKFKYGKEMFLIGLAVPIITTLVLLHPYYLSYYSPFLGGLRRGIYDIEPKWMIGHHEIVDHFEEVIQEEGLEKYEPGESLDSQLNKMSIRNKLTVGFQEKYYTQIWPFMDEIGARATIKDITVHAENSNYFVYPVYNDDSYLEDRVRLEQVGTVKLRGVDLYNVYKKIP